jgi:cytochrome c oxidase assembly factor CtaG
VNLSSRGAATRRRRGLSVTLGTLLLPRVAWAHPGGALAPHDLWHTWTLAPAVLAGLILAAACYSLGLHAIWNRAGHGRVVPRWRAGAFAVAVVVLMVALISPVDRLGSALFSAHMLQHLLLMMVAAPLMALAEPFMVTLWALPLRWRRAVGRTWLRARGVRTLWSALSVPGVAWLLHIGTLWVWHLPTLYERALRDERIHALEHASFFVTALLFWWVLVRPRGHRIPMGAAVAYLFGAALQSTILGALITMSRRPWYPSHFGTTQPWGLTPLEDQQLAGLLMWIPAGIVYLIPLVPLVTRALGSASLAIIPKELHGAAAPAAAGVSARGTP